MKRALSPEDRDFRDRLRTFFTTEVPADLREKVAAGRELSREDWVRGQQVLNAAGLAVPGWPVEWGGKDWTDLQKHIWHEEMQLAAVPAPLAFNVSMVGPVIAAFGNEEQKRRFLPATANLDIWWSQGFSEPEAGSDLAGLRTRAVRDGDEYVVNGQKTWTTLGQYGDWIFTLVRTDPDAPKKQQGISFLLIDMSTPGLTVRPIELIDGSREVNEVWFEDVRVPAENLVGEENMGWTYAKFLLGNERVGIARVGSSKLELAALKQRAADTVRDGRPVLDDPLVAARVAELENDLLALELTALRVTAGSADGKQNPASSVLKLKGSELAEAISELAVDVAGPASVAAAEESGLPEWQWRSGPHYLNMRKVSIFGGSNEIQRGIIAGTILGLG